jgi:hypothetical protein
VQTAAASCRPVPVRASLLVECQIKTEQAREGCAALRKQLPRLVDLSGQQILRRRLLVLNHVAVGVQWNMSAAQEVIKGCIQFFDAVETEQRRNCEQC